MVTFLHEEEAGTLEAEVAEGESLCLDTLRKGLYFEVGEPFDLVKFDVRKRVKRSFSTPGFYHKPKPKTEPQSEPQTVYIPIMRQREERRLSCSFCGGKHFPISQETMECMDVFWTLHELRGGKDPSQEEVASILNDRAQQKKTG